MATKRKGTKQTQVDIAVRKYKRMFNEWLVVYRSGDKWRRQYRIAEVEMREANQKLTEITNRQKALNSKRKNYENELIRRGLWEEVKKRI